VSGSLHPQGPRDRCAAADTLGAAWARLFELGVQEFADRTPGLSVTVPFAAFYIEYRARPQKGMTWRLAIKRYSVIVFAAHDADDALAPEVTSDFTDEAMRAEFLKALTGEPAQAAKPRLGKIPPAGESFYDVQARGSL
jgi:hypothetical protein